MLFIPNPYDFALRVKIGKCVKEIHRHFIDKGPIYIVFKKLFRIPPESDFFS